MTATILLTGFGPFPGAPFNPTEPLIAALVQRRHPGFANVRRVAHTFRVSYEAVDRELPALLAREKPDVLVMFGLAPGARQLRVETRARNALALSLPDADGHLATATMIAPGAPATLPLRTPVNRLVAAAQSTGAPAVPSRNAGRYLCNYLCWRAAEANARPRAPRVTAFIHVPMLRHPGRLLLRHRPIALDDLIRAGETIVLAALAAARSQSPAAH